MEVLRIAASTSFSTPEPSGWECHLFGSKDRQGITYFPAKGAVPNFFVRWMMKICLGCTWVKTPVQSANQ